MLTNGSKTAGKLLSSEHEKKEHTASVGARVGALGFRPVTFLESVDEFDVFGRERSAGAFDFEQDLLNELDRSLVEVIELLVCCAKDCSIRALSLSPTRRLAKTYLGPSTGR